MLSKLQAIEARYRELEARSADPALAADGQALAALMKEYKRLSPVVDAYRALLAAEQEAKEAAELAKSATDAELRAFAEAEAKTANGQIAALTERLRLLLLPRDENDDRDIIVEIRAGAGGEEAALFAADLFRMYAMYAAAAGFTVHVLSQNETELGGYKELVFQVSGEGAFARFKFESGVHRVQRVPVTESQGRIQTSTVTVAVLPEAEEVEVRIDPADVVMESCKSSGAGGQHINKTESAVRLTHKPTGIVVECQQERSQFQNREKAMQMLRAILYDREQRAKQDARDSQRRMQVGTGDRSEKIRTYNYHEGRVTDHRIGLTLYALDKILAGGLDPVVDALTAAENAAKLQENAEGAFFEN